MTREAELELEIARLREALLTIKRHFYEDEEPRVFINEALSTPPSTTALQELIEKVERRTIERCLETVIDERLVDNTGHPCDEAYNEAIEHCNLAIRALPTGNLKLEDL